MFTPLSSEAHRGLSIVWIIPHRCWGCWQSPAHRSHSFCWCVVGWGSSRDRFPSYQKGKFHVLSSCLGPGQAGTTSSKVKYLFQSKFNPKNRIHAYDADRGLAAGRAQKSMLWHRLLREEKAFTCESTTRRREAGGEAQICLPDPGSRRVPGGVLRGSSEGFTSVTHEWRFTAVPHKVSIQGVNCGSGSRQKQERASLSWFCSYTSGQGF